MNGLTLRVNPSNKKTNNSIGFAPVALLKYENTGTQNELFEKFLEASTADEQLSLMKNILNTYRDSVCDETLKFLALVFLQAESKHPVKCFLSRHITKTESLQQPFAEKLGEEIKNLIASHHAEYTQYAAVVGKVATCIENFPAGSIAFRITEIELAKYLTNCLQCCVRTLSEAKLSPTEKNEIYTLTHLALRLFLYIVQKISEDNVSDLVSLFKTIKMHLKYLIFDEDAPMDTKSLSGILFLTMLILEDGPDSWTDILEPSPKHEYVNTLLQSEAGQLSLYSGVATVVSAARLQARVDCGGEYAIMSLIDKIMAIGERSLSESTYILGVTRTIVQISKMVDKVTDPELGLALTDKVLSFAWGHLEHYMDSVRHLSAQALTCVVKYCARLETLGDSTAMDRLFTALSKIDRSRKSYYVGLTSLAAQLGARRLMRRLPGVICDVIGALDVQAVQASATTALETLLQKHTIESSTEELYTAWVQPILAHVRARALDSPRLNILEALMAKAVSLDDNIIHYILPHIKESCESNPSNVKCNLLLLLTARRAVPRCLATACSEQWRGGISSSVLERAAVDAAEETRILSLSLVVESPKSTEVFTEGDLNFVLYYLRYNINAQSPNFRQLTLSLLKKFTKRLEESYKAFSKSKDTDSSYYLSFVERLRALCFSSLIPAANYSRRFVALQLLAWLDGIGLEGYQRVWKQEYIEKLLLHLEDSYENNKALALQVLDKCPSEHVKGKNYCISLDIESILRQASSMKPTDCVSAAYKLNFVQRKLPEYILEGNTCTSESEPVLYALMSRLLEELEKQVAVCSRSVVGGAREAPMYGILHCMGHLLQELNASAITEDKDWKALVERIIETCVVVNGSVACVVNNSSPEGHLPMDAGGVATHDYGNSGDVRLEDGRPVTAQMVLLCAWRSVKEVSLLLGSLCSRLSIEGEGEGQEGGTLSARQVLQVGGHFTRLLADTKHRGAFEQAYVGFTRLLARLWRCRSASLHGLPRAWLQDLIRALSSPRPSLSATRRSAGLPFMIQALVTTELQVQGNPKCLHECMTTLLKLARFPSRDKQTTTNDINSSDQKEDNHIQTKEINEKRDPLVGRTDLNDSRITKDNLEHSDNDVESNSKDSMVETRTHSLNILRALFRNSALDESVAGYVGEGLMVALDGFEGDTWMERNSSTLLFSALMVRVFGVARARSDTPPLRNTMTGRIFFLRYPRLYACLLDKLKEATSSVEERLHPSLYPVLVLLGRLYPSALEGAASALRLAPLVPLVRAAAASRVLPTRQLAARALPPLLAPEQYVAHVESMLTIISDPAIERNYCHGILLQLTRLLDYKPDVTIDDENAQQIKEKIKQTFWVLEQAGRERPCYVIVDEYVKMINFFIWRFPSLIDGEMFNNIQENLHKILFTLNIPPITSGRDVCLANILNVYFVILNKSGEINDICELILSGLGHKSYEVVLSTLNYLLLLHKSLEIDNCKFQMHLSTMVNENILIKLREYPEYIQKLCSVFQNNKYQECQQKSLKVLTLEDNTQKYIVGIKKGSKSELSDNEIIAQLIDCVHNEHENMTHIYLESLSKFISKKLEEAKISIATVLDVLRVIFACSSSDNSDNTRCVVAGFMEKNFGPLLKLDLKGLSEENKFEFKSLIFGTTVTILEDDDESIRQRTSDLIASSAQTDPHHRSVIASKAAEMLRELAAGEGAAMLVLLALLDFKSEVCITDEISDECRVFDQNERYNIYLEECMWTIVCADKITEMCKDNQKAIEFVRRIIEDDRYRRTIDKLCNINIVLFKRILSDDHAEFNNALINPKIKLFIDKLSSLV